MIAWITGNAVTIIALTVVLLLLGIALASLIKEKKNPSPGCGGNCATCGMGCAGGRQAPASGADDPARTQKTE